MPAESCSIFSADPQHNENVPNNRSRERATENHGTWEENYPMAYLIKALERIGIFADQQYQGGGLRVGFGSALFPFLESSLVDSQLAGEDGTRATQFFARVPDQL